MTVTNEFPDSLPDGFHVEATGQVVTIEHNGVWLTCLSPREVQHLTYALTMASLYTVAIEDESL